MKYLKLFESFDEIYNDLEELCIGTVAYITDDIPDFKFRIEKASVPDNKYIKSTYPLDSEIYLVSFFRSEPNHNKFDWLQVKDKIIHFFKLIDSYYDLTNNLSITFMTNKIEPIKIKNKEEPGIDHIISIDDILNDNIRNNAEIMNIQTIIKVK